MDCLPSVNLVQSLCAFETYFGPFEACTDLSFGFWSQVFVIFVTWKDNSVNVVYRTYQTFARLQVSVFVVCVCVCVCVCELGPFRTCCSVRENVLSLCCSQWKETNWLQVLYSHPNLPSKERAFDTGCNSTSWLSRFRMERSVGICSFKM